MCDSFCTNESLSIRIVMSSTWFSNFTIFFQDLLLLSCSFNFNVKWGSSLFKISCQSLSSFTIPSTFNHRSLLYLSITQFAHVWQLLLKRCVKSTITSSFNLSFPRYHMQQKTGAKFPNVCGSTLQNARKCIF